MTQRLPPPPPPGRQSVPEFDWNDLDTSAKLSAAQTTLQHHSKLIDEVRGGITEIKGSLADLHTVHAETKGAFRVIKWLGGVLIALGLANTIAHWALPTIVPAAAATPPHSVTSHP